MLDIFPTNHRTQKRPLILATLVTVALHLNTGLSVRPQSSGASVGKVHSSLSGIYRKWVLAVTFFHN